MFSSTAKFVGKIALGTLVVQATIKLSGLAGALLSGLADQAASKISERKQA